MLKTILSHILLNVKIATNENLIQSKSFKFNKNTAHSVKPPPSLELALTPPSPTPLGNTAIMATSLFLTMGFHLILWQVEVCIHGLAGVGVRASSNNNNKKTVVVFMYSHSMPKIHMLVNNIVLHYIENFFSLRIN